MEVGTCGDRQLVLAALRKQFAASLKASKSGRNNSSSCFPPAGDVATTGVGCNGNDQQQLLALFTKAMNHFTPEELCLQFKEYLLFTAQIAEELVQEIRRRAGSDNTREAARAVYSFLRAEPPDSRGWQLLTAVIFISNSGAPKVFECLCKTLLPNTLIKVSYLFMDLPETDDPEEAAHRRRLYDSLVMLLMNLCAQPQVAEELIQKDDLFLLFIGASSRSPSPANIWRNANFTFLCSLVAKALTPPVLKYIHSKRCIAHYLANIGTVDDQEEQSVLLCNLLDLLRSSADNSQRLVDDFGTANGFHFIVEFCTRGSVAK